MKINSIPLIIIFTLLCFYDCQSQNKEIDSLKRVLSVAKIDSSKVTLYNAISDNYKYSFPDSTNFYANKALQLAIKTNNKFGIATSYVNLGNSNLVIGNYLEAKTKFVKAKNEFENLLIKSDDNKKYKAGLARAFASLGVIYSEQNNYYYALENYQNALKIYQELKQQNNISKALNNIGIVYKSQTNNTKALEYFNKAYSIQLETGEESAAVTLTNIGVVYFENKKYDLALEYYLKAENLFSKIGNKRGFALLYNYIGDYYQTKKDVKLSQKYYNKSLNLSEEIQDRFIASLTLYKIGQLLFEQNKFTEALPFATKSLNYAKEINVLDQTFHAEKLLSELHGSLNNPAESLKHYKNYIEARDSISNQENTKKFAISEMNFEYKKKEALLEEKSKRQMQFTLFSILGALLLGGLIFLYFNRKQVKKRLTLQKEVAEYEQKALHLQMNPHFVFNCLGSISSFIVQNGTDSALKYLSKFSKLMRLTLEYSKGSLIPIDKEIESLQNYLELEQLRFHDKFTFSISSSDKVEFNMGLPPLLIQPFVENAILHGMVPKKGNGKIDVNFDVENNQLICSIKDNGIGISQSQNIKENSVTAHKSMALDITKKRLEIMEETTTKAAQIEIIEKNGTIVTLRLPIQYIQ